MALPRWNSKKGWIGGDTRTLYAYTDKRTNRVTVRPGPGTRFGDTAVGDHATVRVATRAEVDASDWPKGWKTLGNVAVPFAYLARGAAEAARRGDCTNARALVGQMLVRARTSKERNAVMRVQGKVRSCSTGIGRSRRRRK